MSEGDWIVAGFDEAGYGPKLGPLTVGYSAFRVREGEGDLYTRLFPAARREAKGDPHGVWVADSKKIKPRKDGVKLLELAVLGFWASAGELPPDLGALLRAVGQDPSYPTPWLRELGAGPVPGLAWGGEVEQRAAKIREVGSASGVEFLGFGARVLSAAQLNALYRRLPNKGAVLSEQFVGLLRQLRALAPGRLVVVADKHGGRSAYARLLGTAFPNCAIEIDGESQARSAYRVATKQGPLWVSFRQEAEDFSLATALASMLCKYLRERGMQAFNAWFAERVDGLKATAGYGQDANRFLEDVRGKLDALEVGWDTLVRAR
ncbi:MAG: hypothetical protein KDD82_14945 [Planctomycetes bacterium]|nr:hypothetical protein [Planctomycetota bacterium]